VKLLAIDPGTRHTGIAEFEDGLLQRAFVVEGQGFKGDIENITSLATMIWTDVGDDLDRVVIEWQQVYGGLRAGGRKDPNDLFPLTSLAGALAYAYRDAKVSVVKPSEWKGSRNDVATALAIYSRLREDEILEIEFESELAADIHRAIKDGKGIKHKAHNALDAVGIGLHALGRFEKLRVIAR
jgi:hypothetical protein